MDPVAAAVRVIDGDVSPVLGLLEIASDVCSKPVTVAVVHVLKHIASTLKEIMEETSAECVRRRLDFIESSAVMEAPVESYSKVLVLLRRSAAQLSEEEANIFGKVKSQSEESLQEEEEESPQKEEEELQKEEEEPQKEEEEKPQEEKVKPEEEVKSDPPKEEKGAGRAPATQPSASKSQARKPPRCFYCDELHEVYRCRPYQLLLNEERLRLIDIWKLCLNCFSPRHGANECWKDPRCEFCQPKQYHHPELHHGLRDAGRL